MGVTNTTNYNLIKPNPGEERDAWGPYLNTNMDTIDAQIKARADAITALQSGKQDTDADLTAIAALAGTSGILKKTGANTWSLDTTSYSPVGHTHVIADVTGLQTALDGKQPLDAELTAIAALAPTADYFIVGDGSTWTAESPSQARASLGLGGLAVLSAVGAAEITDGSVGTAELANASVTTTKITDSNVTEAKLAAGSVTTAKIADSSITTSKIADNAVDGTKIALGADAQGDVMYYDGTNWARLAAGTAGQSLFTQGPGSNPLWRSPIVRETAKTLSGLSTVSFTGIPSWARSIKVCFADVSLSSASDFVVKIGTSGGVVSTGYKSTSQAVLNDSGGGGNIISDYGTNGFTVCIWSSAYSSSGAMRLNNITGTVWVEDHTLGTYSGGTSILTAGGGILDLAGTLETVEIAVASGTFDAGTVNIIYE